MSSVLVISVDPNIEMLLGQLVEFSGHHPIYDVTVGAAGEAIRRARPAVVLLDTALPRDVIRACLAAADEMGTEVVLTSSSASVRELEAEAAARREAFFDLTAGPQTLAAIINRLLSRSPQRPAVAIPRTFGAQGASFEDRAH